MTKKYCISFVLVLSLILSCVVVPVNAVDSLETSTSADANASRAIFDGTYFLQNCESQTFMQIDDNASDNAQSAKMELWPFAATERQQWIFESLGNGYYKITSAKSGLALSVKSGDEDSEGSVLIQETFNEDEDEEEFRQQWLVTFRGTTGTVIIKPRSNTNFRMAMGGGIFTYDGRNVEQRESQSGDGDEWYMQPVDNYAHVTLPARIYYDSTLLQDNITEEGLRQEYAEATATFLEYFHLGFDVLLVEQSPLLERVTDGCDVAHTLDGGCNVLCGDLTLCHTLHHRSAGRLITECLRSNQYYTIRAVGYGICSYIDYSHGEPGGTAVVGGKDSIVTNNSTMDLDIEIQHELLHNLGLNHCGSDNCIMGDNTIDRFCETCIGAIWNFVLTN